MRMIILTGALLLAVPLVPLTESDAAYPPSGKYLDITRGKIVLYDRTLGTLTDTADPLPSDICYGYPDTEPESRCGQCSYVGEPTLHWTSYNTVWSDVGVCNNLLCCDEYYDWSYLRMDVRVVDNAAWGWSGSATYWTYWSGSYHNYPTHYYPWKPCASATVGGSVVSYCADGTQVLSPMDYADPDADFYGLTINAHNNGGPGLVYPTRICSGPVCHW